MSFLVGVLIVCFITIIGLNIIAVSPREKFTRDPTLNLTKIRGIAFSSAGVLGYAFVGALKNLIARGLDVSASGMLDYFAGASAGSILAVLLACRVPLDRIDAYYQQLEVKDVLGVKHDTYIKSLKTASLRSSHFMEDSVEHILYEHTGIRNITLEQIYEKYGTTVILSGTNVNYISQPLYMSRFSHPDLSAARAARASSSIPLLFAPVRIDEFLVMDGAAVDACVIKELQHYLDISEILCMSIDYLDMVITPETVIKKCVRDVSAWFFGIYRVHPANQFTRAEKQRTIYIACIDCPSTLNFYIDGEDKKKIFQSGSDSVDRYFSDYEYYL
jgi:predicted acylesterase/phospholipase RssA